ncbi:DUF3141 domain-containing protein [Desulfococcaceae bacterium OttesenSCG-928-F15]|nr:DUF3141 domain-containing protein [Desulfococcaceae bacterium OttesenSCG-928-F15]
MKFDVSSILEKTLPLGKGFALADYLVDTVQRQILFWDTLRGHGNDFFQYLEDGQPPVLYFPYEIVLDGRTFERPVNYALVRIHDQPDAGKKALARPGMRPVVVIDPRSGNAPGLGGFKRASEMGIALEKGHPVYSIIFFPQPAKGQTLADVARAELRFIEEVNRRHPGADKASVIGNSQAGWAIAMMGATNPETVGPLVLNGSPISYWAGKRGRHVVRYKAGLIGGVWSISFLSDLGSGYFDGANLASGQEIINPGAAYFRVPYKLYSKVDTEAERFRDFSRWWSSYYLMTEEEIYFMIQHLFIENRLERGDLEFKGGKRLDLKDLEDPIVLFSSDGDNVTPPQQALNWIVKVWGSLAEIKRQNQVIVYMVHKNVGHIGLFVSDKVAGKEHAEIIENIDMVNFLAPGLYEMVITKGDPRYTNKPYQVHYELRTFEDIKKLDDGLDDELDFYPVAEISKINDLLYRTFARPWVRFIVSPPFAAWLRMNHPQRFFRMAVADINPMMLGVKLAAEEVREHRHPVFSENVFRKAEETVVDAISICLDTMTKLVEAMEEQFFIWAYSNPLMRIMASQAVQMGLEEEKPEDQGASKKRQDEEEASLREKIGQGGFSEALVRVLLATAGVNRSIHQAELATLLDLIRSHPKTRGITNARLRSLIQEQARILELDPEGALAALPKMLEDPLDRTNVLEMAKSMARSDFKTDKEEKKFLKHLFTIFGETQ